MNVSFWRPALLVAACALLVPAAHAQSGHARKTAPTTATAASAAPREAAAGTFQLVPLTQKVQIALTTDALAEIERRRQENDEVNWPISPYAHVRILPRRVIMAPGFQPLPPVAPVPAQ